MKKGHTLRTVLIVCIAAAASVTGLVVFLANRRPSRSVDVVPVGNVSTSYWRDNQTLDGYVTEGALQEVVMTEGGFARIAVKEGDTVRKGDTLVEYDNTQSALILQGDAARIAVIEGKLAVSEEGIENNEKMIAALRKLLSGMEKDSAPLSPPSGSSETTGIKTQVEINADTVGKSFSVEVDGKKKPSVRYNCVASTRVVPEFLEKLSFGATKKDDPYFICFDVYTVSVAPEETPLWQARWTLDAASLQAAFHGTPPSAPWIVGDGLLFDKEGSFTGFQPTALPPFGTLSLLYPQDLIDLPDTIDPDELPQTPEGIKAKIKSLYEQIDAEEQRIDGFQRELRQAKLNYEKDKLIQQNGKVVSSVDGTVTLVNADMTTPIGEAVVRVQGASNYAVTLFVNELMLDTVKVGSVVQLQCYESGTMTSAQISELNTTPATNYYSGGNMNSSTYQVTAEISDTDVQPRLGEWCEATLGSEPTQADADTIYLPLFLVREDDAGKYVMRADENERLQKCYIATGKTIWGSYIEIKQGILYDDHLAFPYGNAVREGAPVNYVDYFNY